jgi:hypothetical protein
MYRYFSSLTFLDLHKVLCSREYYLQFDKPININRRKLVKKLMWIFGYHISKNKDEQWLEYYKYVNPTAKDYKKNNLVIIRFLNEGSIKVALPAHISSKLGIGFFQNVNNAELCVITSNDSNFVNKFIRSLNPNDLIFSNNTSSRNQGKDSINYRVMYYLNDYYSFSKNSSVLIEIKTSYHSSIAGVFYNQGGGKTITTISLIKCYNTIGKTDWMDLDPNKKTVEIEFVNS